MSSAETERRVNYLFCLKGICGQSLDQTTSHSLRNKSIIPIEIPQLLIDLISVQKSKNNEQSYFDELSNIFSGETVTILATRQYLKDGQSHKRSLVQLVSRINIAIMNRFFVAAFVLAVAVVVLTGW